MIVQRPLLAPLLSRREYRFHFHFAGVAYATDKHSRLHECSCTSEDHAFGKFPRSTCLMKAGFLYYSEEASGRRRYVMVTMEGLG